MPVQIEEDIDDGLFTTIDKQQWVGSVFKREKIHEDDDAMMPIQWIMPGFEN